MSFCLGVSSRKLLQMGLDCALLLLLMLPPCVYRGEAGTGLWRLVGVIPVDRFYLRPPNRRRANPSRRESRFYPRAEFGKNSSGGGGGGYGQRDK